MEYINPNKSTSSFKEYFSNPANTKHKQYESLRAFFLENLPAPIIAEKYGYTVNTLYSMIRDFKLMAKAGEIADDPFFKSKKLGRREMDKEGAIKQTIIRLRKQYISVPDIKVMLDAQNHTVSERYISTILNIEGFGRLPRRDKESREKSISWATEKIEAPKSVELTLESESFSSNSIGLLCFLPYIKEYEIDKVIEASLYPSSTSISKKSSIYSFLALKLSNIRRYNADDVWCMDRGMGLFAILNVLPKTAWFSSYSHRVTRKMNLEFLRQLHKIWKRKGLLSDTMNLDFTTIPYWGEGDHLENNWSGKRNKSLSSMLAVLAQDPDSGIIDYGATNVRHKNESGVVLEFLDFYRDNNKKDRSLRYLVFDSKFTTYENLRKMDGNNVKFLTIRRRGKNVLEKIRKLPSDEWQKIHVINADGKGRNLKVYEEKIKPVEYGKQLRQIVITGHGKIKAALLITNDFQMKIEDVIRKYSRRWLVEKGISEQIEFFHLNRVSSSIVVKVDFDFTMTILAHNLYRLFASKLEGYSHQTDLSIFQKFIYNSGDVRISSSKIFVRLKKKRHLPLLLAALKGYQNQKIPWLGNREIVFEASATS